MKRADERKASNHQKSGREQSDRMLTQKTDATRPDWMNDPRKLPKKPPPLPARSSTTGRRGES